ncbi:hypothetical protein OF830_15290 [Bacillus paramycoides]|uniref:hypothetical protein n=1 Tax=Bacillus paramycoides TaxID=2026194 RepID=UPI002243EF14|nr:hypothetical protein [Bacillus paramycoides]MCW9132289.1 hypothetical protein [Bacillus paramycoides]
MNSLILFILILVSLNVLIFFLAKKRWRVWRIAGILFIFCSPFVFFITINIIVHKIGDGFAGGAAGFTFAGLLVANAIVYFIVSIFISKSTEN